MVQEVVRKLRLGALFAEKRIPPTNLSYCSLFTKRHV